MKGNPKFEYGQEVKFKCDDEEKVGKIYIIDKYGTFEDPSDVSYDIMVESENCLYKHWREDMVYI